MWYAWWIYWIGPVLGAMFARLVAKILTLDDDNLEILADAKLLFNFIPAF
jgi:hypothetical protein